MIHLGIDCGLDGAIALLDGSKSPVFVDVPTLRAGTNSRRDYDVAAIAAWLTLNVVPWPHMVYLEKQQAMPASLRGRTQGTASSFATGVGYGIWRGILAGLRLRHELVRPRTWKAAMMRDAPAGKDASRAVALRLFPDAHRDLGRKKDHNRADALLIAEYGRRISGWELER